MAAKNSKVARLTLEGETTTSQAPVTRNVTTIHDLPDTVITYIFAHCSWYDLMNSVRFVSDRWNCLASDRDVWAHRLLQQQNRLHRCDTGEYVVDLVKPHDLQKILKFTPHVKKIVFYENCNNEVEEYFIQRTISSYKGITELCLCGFIVDRSMLKMLAENCSNLVKLELSGCLYGFPRKSGTEDYKYFAKMRNLESLKLCKNFSPTADELVLEQILKNSKKLKSLEVSMYYKLTDKTIRNLVTYGQGLTVLKLLGFGLSVLPALLQISYQSNLKVLHLIQLRELPFDLFAALVRGCPHLEEFGFSVDWLNGFSFPAEINVPGLKLLCRNKRLKKINIGNIGPSFTSTSPDDKLSDVYLEAISECQGLERLDLFGLHRLSFERLEKTVDSLSASLGYLSISRCCETKLSIKELIGSLQTRFPRIRMVFNNRNVAC